MTGILILGFVIGMRHALEADHLAAVATLAMRTRTVPAALTQGAIWGIGHTFALLAVAGTTTLLGLAISPVMAARLELGVGVMLIALAVDAARRRFRPDLPLERQTHPHAQPHALPHARAMRWRALLVGSAHGMAGSAALALLAVQAVQSPWLGLLYIALFGLGSVIGMGMLSAALAAPLFWSTARLGRTYTFLSASAAAMSFGVGVAIVASSAAEAF